MDNNIGTKKINTINSIKIYTLKRKVDEQDQPSSFIARTAFTIVKTCVESNRTKYYYLQYTISSHMYSDRTACAQNFVVQFF